MTFAPARDTIASGPPLLRPQCSAPDDSLAFVGGSAVTAPWAPMAAPPLPCRNDEEFDTCEHAYPRETCRGNGLHWSDRDALLLRLEQSFAAQVRTPELNAITVLRGGVA